MTTNAQENAFGVLRTSCPAREDGGSHLVAYATVEIPGYESSGGRVCRLCGLREAYIEEAAP